MRRVGEKVKIYTWHGRADDSFDIKFASHYVWYYIVACFDGCGYFEIYMKSFLSDDDRSDIKKIQKSVKGEIHIIICTKYMGNASFQYKFKKCSLINNESLRSHCITLDKFELYLPQR